jgi:glycosyltransferase involved in cell wall biosynthesis
MRGDANKQLKLAIIGTRGIPAKYGGFETLIEYITKFLADQLDITVFCSKEQHPKIGGYNKAKLVYLPISAHGWQSILYDSLSILVSYKKYDKILVLGCSNVVMFLMGRYKNKFILNIGGIEWQREKWGWFASNFIKYSESISVRNSGYLIADNTGIQDYLLKKYDRSSNIIEYGGDQARRSNIKKEYFQKYPFLKRKYILNVARIQPDNNVEMIIKAFKDDNTDNILIIIGNWGNSKYGINLRNNYQNNENIVLLDAIYNQEELNAIRGNARLYLHGHSAGGTNPGLVEAMHLGLPIFCFDNVFNRYTTENKANYFNTVEQLHAMLMDLSDELLVQISRDMREIANRRYRWETITKKYYDVINASELPRRDSYSTRGDVRI